MAGGTLGDAVNGGFWDANDASAQSTILSGQSTADWLRVDLGAEYVINQIVYDNRYYNTRQFGVTTIYQQTFDLQVSTNGTTWTTVASRSGQTTAQKYVLAITPVTARYVRVTNVLSKYTANANWHHVYATELQVYGAVNLALNKPLAGSVTTLGGGAWGDVVNGGFWDANDASAQSTILSGQSTADWLRVDLGAAYTINYIVYDNRYYNTKQVGVGTVYQQTFNIQVSTNGTTWTTVASRSGQATAQKYVLAITPVTARYVRVTNVL
ncbi:MAG: discoidin domain-containing protein, partial [Thermoflexales bacterium]|nr:discoidin domain-containing protein [Thermoflexales bacterium]